MILRIFDFVASEKSYEDLMKRKYESKQYILAKYELGLSPPMHPSMARFLNPFPISRVENVRMVHFAIATYMTGNQIVKQLGKLTC